ncbi:MAG: MBL fold metallo-hydrolase [Planctomycetia bacterium]|nr:MBL fold metallo-hydrolase [Planctomycetia bacterium]
MSSPRLCLATIPSAPFAENSYVANLEGRSDCLIVDPGLEPDKIIDYVTEQGLTPVALLITHGHADHIAGNFALRERWPACPIVIGREEAPKLTSADLNLSKSFGAPITSPAADVTLEEGEVFELAGLELEARLIPGHSTGHMVYIARKHEPVVVFGGDVLFAGSIGRTDFPGGSFDALAAGIHTKLFTLPDDTIILSGHGPATTVGDEKQDNPFVGRPAGWRG